MPYILSFQSLHLENQNDRKHLWDIIVRQGSYRLQIHNNETIRTINKVIIYLLGNDTDNAIIKTVDNI